MKTEDFEKLKSLCDANGFELVTESPKDNDKFYVVKKKDEWEGVEFAEGIVVGGVYKINDFDNFQRVKKFYKPSTEQSYIEQLKKQAFRMYGEIKEGDRFVDWDGTDFEIGGGSIWKYQKESDELRVNGWLIYQKGKWANKLPKRVEVTYTGATRRPYEINKNFDIYNISLMLNKSVALPESKVFGLLAKQLEKYLNGEVE